MRAGIEEDPIIRVRDLQVAYGKEVILDRLSFEVQPGRIFMVLGGSGCGKSSLMQYMIGLKACPPGRIFVDGEDLGSRLESIRHRIGVMFQGGALFGSMSLLKNVSLPLQEHTRLSSRKADWIASLKLSLVGLGHCRHFLPSQISGGMRKRAAIARAMALDPLILFLDEPSAGLDPAMSAEIDQLILNLSRSMGITFVIVTHELASILSIADEVIMLDRETRGILARGDPRQLQQRTDPPPLARFFSRAVPEPSP